MKTDEIKETKEKLQNIISLLDDVLSGKLTQGKAAEKNGTYAAIIWRIYKKGFFCSVHQEKPDIFRGNAGRYTEKRSNSLLGYCERRHLAFG